MDLKLPRPAIFAHRGASASVPENTLAAFRLALAQSADGIELDVHLTADGHVVVIHDNDLSRTTNGTGLVHLSKLAELRLLDAGQGEGIPTLDNVLELVGDQTILNIEIKGYTRKSQRLAAETAARVQAHGLTGSVLFSSFSFRHLQRIRRIDRSLSIGLLLLPGRAGRLARALYEPILSPWSLHPHTSLVDSKFIAAARRSGRPVIAYTANRPEEIQRLFTLGIDGIFTDDVPTAARIREQRS